MNHSPPRPATSGFTLIEILIGLGLLVVLVAAVMVILPRGTQLVRTSTLSAASNTNVTRTSEQLTQDIASGQSLLQQASQTRLDLLKIQKQLSFEMPPGSRKAGMTTVTTSMTDFDALVGQDVILANTQGDYLITRVESSTPAGSRRTVTFACPIYLPGNVAAYTFRPLRLAYAGATGESASSDGSTLYRSTGSWTPADRALKDVRFAPVYETTNGTFSSTLSVPETVSGGKRLSGIRFVLTGTGEQPVSQASLAGLDLLAVKAWTCGQAPGIPPRNNGKLQINILLDGQKPTTASGTPNVAVSGPGLTTGLNSFMLRVFENLKPGLYNVTAQTFTSGTNIYDASITGDPASVGNGREATVNVNYTVRKGTAVITVSGLPSGVTAPVRVSGPDGQDLNLTNGTHRVDLKPGTYTFSAQDAGGMTPTVTPSSITLQSGQSAAVNIDYAYPNGTLSVQVYGLPSGVQGGVHLWGPDSRDLNLGNGTTNLSLPRGTYTVSADSTGGYQPTVMPGNVITLTDSASVVIGYQPPPAATGTLTIQIAGLPAGINTVASWGGAASGSRAAGNGSITLTDIPAGAYSITGTPVAGYSAPAVSANVPSNGTTTANLNFTNGSSPSSPGTPPTPPASTGTLNIQVAGLPAGVTTIASWSGGVSGSRAIGNGTLTLTDIPAGTYAVSGTSVAGYTAPGSTANVRQGGTTTAYLNFTSGTSLVLNIQVDNGMGPKDGVFKTTVTLNGVSREYALTAGTYTFSTDPGTWAISMSGWSRAGGTTIAYAPVISPSSGALQPGQRQEVFVTAEEVGDCTKGFGCN